jgi:hypothetical protein
MPTLGRNNQPQEAAMKSWIWFCSFALALAVLVPATHAGTPLITTGKVFQVLATLQARIESEDSHSNTVLKTTPIKANALVNLAMGRDSKATVPTNQVLAAVIDCGAGIARLIVFDRNTSSNLVTIAVADSTPDVIGAKDKGEFVGLLDLQNVGNGTNGITGGFLVVSGKATVDTSDCVTKAGAAAVGVIDVTISDDTGVHSFTALIPKAQISTKGSSIGSVVEP